MVRILSLLLLPLFCGFHPASSSSSHVIPPTEFPPLTVLKKKAKEDIQSGMVFAFTEDQIDQIIARYQYLISVCFFLFFFPLFFLPLFLSLPQNYFILYGLVV